jgi:hypothetical protein
MPGCSLERVVNGGTALYRIAGKFEGACAWELAGRLTRETLGEVVVDFSQVNEFVDYGIAVIASAIISCRTRRIALHGLRQHQERLFQYFGVDPETAAASPAAGVPDPAARSAQEVA